MQAVSPTGADSPRKAAMRALKMARPASHPFKATWSGQPSPSGRSSRSASGTLLGAASSRSSPCGGPRKATACWRRGLAQVPADRPRSRSRLLLLVLLPLAVGVAAAAARGIFGPDPCSDSDSFELVSVHRREGPVDVPLPDFQLSAFRSLAEPEFEVRRGSGPNEVKFRPRLAETGLAGARRTWTRGRLVASVAEPRLGRQRFSLADLPEGCHRGAAGDFAGHLAIFAAFRRAYDGEGGALARAGRWWLKDGNQFSNATNDGLGLALREGYSFSDPSSDLGFLRQQLWSACGDSARFPKVL